MRDPNAEILKELRALRASVDRTNALLEGLASRNSGHAEKPSDPFANIAGLTEEQRARMTASVAERGANVP